MKNYYKILEVQENSTEEEIKKSYRRLSKKYHPDLNPEGSDKFRDVLEAYEVLIDANKRKEYDFMLRNPNSNGSLHNFFEQMFNNGGSFNNRNNSPSNKVINLEVSPIESYLGSEKSFFYNRYVGCVDCSGMGGDRNVCSKCNGSGVIISSFGTGFLMQRISSPCDQCKGKGFTIINPCYSCSGDGTTIESKQLKVKIPKNVSSGQYLKLRSLGDYSSDGNYGDLVIRINVLSKDGFEKSSNNLIYNLFLDLSSINNEEFIIPHPSGNLTIKSPKLFDTSKPLRVKGKGYSGGDMYVNLHVKFDRS